MNYFAKNLNYLRTSRRLTRYELACKLGVNQSTISRWENENMGVNVDNAYDVAKFFNISVADLVGTDMQNINENENKNSIEDIKNCIENLPECEMTEENKKSLISLVDYYNEISKKEKGNKSP